MKAIFFLPIGLILTLSLAAMQTHGATSTGENCKVVSLFMEELPERPVAYINLGANYDGQFLYKFIFADDSFIKVLRYSSAPELYQEDIYCILERGFE